MAIHAAKLGPKNLTTKKKKKKVKTAIFAPRLARAREQYLMALASASVRPLGTGACEERERAYSSMSSVITTSSPHPPPSELEVWLTVASRG